MQTAKQCNCTLISRTILSFTFTSPTLTSQTFTIMPQFLLEIKLSVFNVSLHINKLKGLKAYIAGISSIFNQFNQFQSIAYISDRTILVRERDRNV